MPVVCLSFQLNAPQRKLWWQKPVWNALVHIAAKQWKNLMKQHLHSHCYTLPSVRHTQTHWSWWICTGLNVGRNDLSHLSFIKTTLNSSKCITIFCSLLVTIFVMDDKINHPCRICPSISKLPLTQAVSFHCLRASHAHKLYGWCDQLTSMN